MHRSFAGLAVLIVAALAAAAPAPAADRYLDPVFSEIVAQPDVPYGSAVNNRNETQTLLADIYSPPLADANTRRPAIVYAHGGGFRGYDRKDARSAPLWTGWAQRGFVVLSIEYRLRPSGTPGAVSDPQLIAEALSGTSPTMQDAQHDMQAAVRWVRAHAGELGVDPDQIVASGESAGAITAWHTAINPEDPGTSGTPGVSSQVAAAVSLWGAADPDQIEAGTPPVLAFHGVMDSTVPMPLETQACGQVMAHGDTCEQVVWPTERHAAFARAPEILETSSNFLCRQVIAGCTAPAPQLPFAISPSL